MQSILSSLSSEYGISLVLRFDSETVDANNRGEVIKGVNRAVVYQQGLDLTSMVIEKMSNNVAQSGRCDTALIQVDISKRSRVGSSQESPALFFCILISENLSAKLADVNPPRILFNLPIDMNIAIFEDSAVEKLTPITTSKPAYVISCGGFRLIDLADRLTETNDTNIISSVRTPPPRSCRTQLQLRLRVRSIAR